MPPRKLHDDLDTRSLYGEKLHGPTLRNETNGAPTVRLRPVGRPYGSFTARRKAIRFIYGLSEGCMVYLRPVGRPYGSITASLERRLEGSLEGTSGRNFLCISVFYGFIFMHFFCVLWFY